MTFCLQLCIVLAAILMGARLRGVGLGAMGGLGVLLLTFGFHLPPSSPPFKVLLVIATIVTAASTLEAAGSLAYLTQQAERVARKHPQYITIIGPILAYLCTFLAGTSHITYSILPIIAQVARDAGIRPERPLTATVIASQQAIIASPISAAIAVVLASLGNLGITLNQLLVVLVPATVCGTLAATLVASRLGVGDIHFSKIGASATATETANHSRATLQQKGALLFFLLGVVAIVATGIFSQQLRPSWYINGHLELLSTTHIIAMIMLSVTALILLCFPIKTSQVTQGRVFSAGMQAIIAILGIAWLGATFFQGNSTLIATTIRRYILSHPWQFGIFLFLTTIVSSSQAATLQLLLPLAVALGLPKATLIGILPAVNAFFFLPSYPTIQAAIELDSTGTTRVGRWVLNHSFMLPGATGALTAVTISYMLAQYWIT